MPGPYKEWPSCFEKDAMTRTHEMIVDAVTEILTSGGHQDDVDGLIYAAISRAPRPTRSTRHTEMKSGVPHVTWSNAIPIVPFICTPLSCYFCSVACAAALWLEPAVQPTGRVTGKRQDGGGSLLSAGGMLLETAINKPKDSDGRTGKPLSARTIGHILFVVNAALRKAVKWRLLDHNCMEQVDRPTKKTKAPPKVLDNAAMKSLSERAANTRPYPLLVLAAATGCRRGKLLALEWSDLNFKTGALSVSKSLEETKNVLRVKSTIRQAAPVQMSVRVTPFAQGGIAGHRLHSLRHSQCKPTDQLRSANNGCLRPLGACEFRHYAVDLFACLAGRCERRGRGLEYGYVQRHSGG
jgi:hypothetical protein